MGGVAVEDGFKARAGALTLLYLSSPMERSVLLALIAEMTADVRLQEIEPPSEEFLSMGIFEDSYLLEPADPNHPPGAPIDENTLLQPTAAGREVPFVGAALEKWLARCLSGPLTHGPESASQIGALLAGWCSTVVHAVAAGPRSAAQVQETIQILDLEVVEARLDSMARSDLLAQAPDAAPEEPPRFEATPWLRRAIAPLAVAARMEHRHPPGDTAPVSALDVEAAFLLTLPLLKLPRKLSGSCALQVVLDEGVFGSPAGVTVWIERGRIVECAPGLDGEADALASASTGEWLDALIEGKPGLVGLEGDAKPAAELLRALHKTLFRGLKPLRFRR